jgi:ESCRT-II complex subunit VPS22
MKRLHYQFHDNLTSASAVSGVPYHDVFQSSRDDVTRAMTKLKVLGSGFEILRIGSRTMLQSVPMEISNDHTTILLYAQEKGFVTYSMIRRELNWSKDRIDVVLVRFLAL